MISNNKQTEQEKTPREHKNKPIDIASIESHRNRTSRDSVEENNMEIRNIIDGLNSNINAPDTLYISFPCSISKYCSRMQFDETRQPLV
jgi:hypothetical protein